MGANGITTTISDVLSEPGRMEALRRTGVTARPDPRFDAVARLVVRLLRVPVALVTIVLSDRQVFPGLAGLPEPWSRTRQTTLEESFCQYVVRDGPLIVPDARIHARVRDNLAIPNLGVIAYAGMPLTDDAGRRLGSLCAIDTIARSWSPVELRDLEDLASGCSAELRLRILRTGGPGPGHWAG